MATQRMINRCSFCLCPNPENTLSEQTGKVSIKVYLQKQQKQQILKFFKESESTQKNKNNSSLTLGNQEWFLIKWSRHGRTNFHGSCWETILSNFANRSPQSSHPPTLQSFSFGATERKLLKEASTTAEYFDPIDTIKRKVKILCSFLQRKNARLVFFTGAGISTSAGIGDFRGPEGKWTEMDQRKEQGEDFNDDDSEEEAAESTGVPYEDLRPTFAHHAINYLLKNHTAHFLVSQNCDGLHVRSGVPHDKIAELHGNVFKEYCENCSTVYYRPYYTCDDSYSSYFGQLEALQEELNLLQNNPRRKEIVLRNIQQLQRRKKPNWKKCPGCGLNHHTQNKCDHCSSSTTPVWLRDSIINFGDCLDSQVLSKARQEMAKADCVISVGSSMCVTPASTLVKNFCDKKRTTTRHSRNNDNNEDEEALSRASKMLVICNRQPTNYDDESEVRLFCDADIFFQTLISTLTNERELQVVQQTFQTWSPPPSSLTSSS